MSDIPSVRGANRDRYSLRVLQAIGTSGLFEQWRIVEAGAVTWFYEGRGGAYDYWPDGLSGAMQSERPPFDNVALVADNDRMFHRIGWVGHPAPDDHKSGVLAAPLSEERITEIFAADLLARGIEAPPSTSPLTDEDWVDVVHTTYYPPVIVAD